MNPVLRQQTTRVPGRLGWTWLLPGLLFGLAACDASPGPASTAGQPPLLSAFTFSPDSVVFEDLPGSQIVADTLARFPLTMSVRVTDPDDDVDSVFYALRSPLTGDVAVQGGALNRGADGLYTRDVLVSIARGDVGLYTLVVYAVDEQRQLSNQVRGMLRFGARESNPPVIEAVEGPDEFRPPGTLVLVAVVSDPDGLSNIRRVIGKAPNGNDFDLFDDGRSSGDETARDGRYTASFTVNEATPGGQIFSFRAVDRSGLTSETVEKTITILP